MKLLHMYHPGMGWLETPSIYPERVYVYWLADVLEEHTDVGNIVNSNKVPIGTNPFN